MQVKTTERGWVRARNIVPLVRGRRNNRRVKKSNGELKSKYVVKGRHGSVSSNYSYKDDEISPFKQRVKTHPLQVSFC